MRKILLVQPIAFSKFPGMPMGMLYTAAALKNDYQIDVLDLNATPLDPCSFRDRLEDYRPDVVMIGGTSPSQPEAYEMAAAVKNWSDVTLVIKGGPHELFCSEVTARNKHIDYVISGDGEAAPELLRRIHAKEQQGKVFRGTVKDLSVMPLPDRHLLYRENPQYYDFLGIPTAQTRFDRGCTFSCSYCSQGSYRSYTDDYIRRDIDQIRKDGFKAIYWDSALFTAEPGRVFTLMEYVRPFNFKMSGITRAGVNTDPELLGTMWEAGFQELWISLESGSEKILKGLGRNDAGPDKVKQAVENAKSSNLKAYVNIILGSPDETDDTVDETIKALLAIKPDGVSASVYTVYPRKLDCDKSTYEKRINRDHRLKLFDEGYGGKILIDPGQAEEWYMRVKNPLEAEGIKMLDYSDCRTPEYWFPSAKLKHTG